MSDRHLVRFAVYVVLRRGERVAMLRRANSGWEDGSYSLIAGHVDPGESALTAAVRESHEEVGVSIDAADLSLVHTMHRRDATPYVDLYFVAAAWSGEPRVMEPLRADDLGWFPLDQLPERTVGSVRQALGLIAAGVTYSDSGW